MRLVFCWSKRSAKKTSMLCHEKSAYIWTKIPPPPLPHVLFFFWGGLGRSLKLTKGMSTIQAFRVLSPHFSHCPQPRPPKSPAPNRSLNITTALWDPSFQCAFHKLYNCSRPESKTIWMTTPNMFGGPGWKFVLLVIRPSPRKLLQSINAQHVSIYIYTYVYINIHQCYRPRKSLPFWEVCADKRTNMDTNNESWFVKETGY